MDKGCKVRKGCCEGDGDATKRIRMESSLLCNAVQVGDLAKCPICRGAGWRVEGAWTFGGEGGQMVCGGGISSKMGWMVKVF